jgi:small subunit ribosomal protein S20
MPNTKSAERRMRSSARKQENNRSVKSRVRTLEKSYTSLLATGKKDEAVTALRQLTSALDKAAKGGVVHRATASRKKSRLASRLNAASTAPAAAAPKTAE